MRVNILTIYNHISYRFLYPLLANRRRLRELGIVTSFYEAIDDSIYDCDAILVDSKCFAGKWRRRDWILGTLEKMKERVGQVVWMDMTASTGTTHFQVLPHVHKYWKKQLLRDRALYARRFYNARIYTDYYQTRFHLPEEPVVTYEPLPPEHAHKVALSWNLSLGPQVAAKLLGGLLRVTNWKWRERVRLPRVRFHPPDAPRPTPISFRGTGRYRTSALSFQRARTIEKLVARGIDTTPRGSWAYGRELRRSRIALSPFGFGELCLRDFEILCAGALLVKPCVDHLETFPDLFRSNETYVPLRWDLEDFDRVVDSLLERPAEAVRMSAQAQERYRYHLARDGQEEFCLRFHSLLAVKT